MMRGFVTLGELAAGTNARVLGNTTTRVRALAYDTRKDIPPGSLFVCLVGRDFDSHHLAQEAVAAGAAALLVNRQLSVEVPQLIVPDTRVAMGLAAAFIYGQPACSLRVVGVTGTKGKTTTTYLVKQLLEHGGWRVGLVGTTGLVVGDEKDVTPFSTTTTPEAPDLQVMLNRMLAAGCDTAVMEVTSHAAALHRIVGTEYDTAVFTNIAPDHLDFHPDFADYLAAKVSFFRHAAAIGSKERKGAVINKDDPYWEAFAAATNAPLITVGIDSADADLRAVDVQAVGGGTSFRLVGKFGATAVAMPLPGVFNVYNALCAVGAALHEGMTLTDIAAALEVLHGVPGRFEKVEAGQDFEVFIDYAHTGPSMQNVLQLARSFTSGRVIVVFGAGGDRARQRRQEMGDAAGRMADYVIITSDNPRSENPDAICEEIAVAVRNTCISDSHWETIVDRRQAIAKAINMAEAGDTVIIAGKGHETYQEVHGIRSHFDDKEEAYQALRESGGSF